MTMKNPDYEIWHAIHDFCGEDGCGHCVVIDLEWTDEQFAKIAEAAERQGESVSIFIHKAIVLGMQSES